MTVYAIDTNLLVYAHNFDSPFHEKAKNFLERVMNGQNTDEGITICIPAQVLTEFVSVITWQRLEKPLSLPQATDVIKDYLNSGVRIITQRETYINNFIDLMEKVTARKKIFDVALAATLKDNEIQGLYTVNVSDFEGFDFLKVVNPLELP